MRSARRPFSGASPAADGRQWRSLPCCDDVHHHRVRGDGRGTFGLQMIKYLGSKRRLVGALTEIHRICGARRALDLFTGTTRVAQAFRGEGSIVTAVDSTLYASVFAETYVA